MTPTNPATTEGAPAGVTPPGAPSDAIMQRLERLSTTVNRGLAAIAGLALAALMLVSVGEMVLRGLGRSLAGSYEVIGWLSAAAMALALGAVQQQRGHVAMELVVVRLGRSWRAGIELLMSLLSLLLFATMAWTLARYGRVLQETGSLSETLRMIVYPWVYLVAAGGAGLTLALSIDCLGAAARLLAALRRPS